MFNIKENLKMLPDSPGVYIYKDKFSQIIYIGKAISLKNRVRQYFQSAENHDPKVKALVSNIDEFEYIVTSTELEALILENNLIKKHQPKYNILLRDDKTFPYIKFTLNEKYPRLIKTRRVENDGAKYFGPFSDAGAVNQTLDLINQTIPLKKCANQKFFKNSKPCLNYHIGLCYGICQGKIDEKTKDKYNVHVENILGFLQGKDKKMLEAIDVKMKKASENLDFENAAKYRDQLNSLKSLNEKQKVALSAGGDIDVIVCENNIGLILFIREGKLVGTESYELSVKENILSTKDELTTAFIKQHYGNEQFIPKEIIVETEISEGELLEKWLAEIKKGIVKIFVPQKGDKKALLSIAQKNISEMSKYFTEKTESKREKQSLLENKLSQIFKMEIKRIESYDISNTSGVDSVGVMVVFQDYFPLKKDYRKFKIKTIEGSNDYGSLQEVIYRRFKKMNDDTLKENDSFAKLPDLLLIDGGENHVNAVKSVIAAMKINVVIAGMVKDEKHKTRGLVYFENDAALEIPLKEDPILYKFIGSIQEEVHRFAIEYHRNARKNSLQRSELDKIEGIGEKRRNALFTHFGSLNAIKEASEDELLMVQGMNKQSAASVKNYFNK